MREVTEMLRPAGRRSRPGAVAWPARRQLAGRRLV